MQVNYAAALGIDLDALLRESPQHPVQLAKRAAHERSAARYWQQPYAPAQLLTLPEAAARAYVCVTTMRRWVARQHVAAHKERGQWHVDAISLDAHLKRLRTKQHAD